MIRREIQFPGGEPQWLLISQVEHARLSGVLAEHCLAHLPAIVREELLQAIIHHDDGWAEWDECPQLDETGRPLSFRELELDDSLRIWTTSIDAAERIGRLAAWIVAGHFLALLNSSDRSVATAATWHDEMTIRRAKWLEAWTASHPQHSHEIAETSLKWLQWSDVMSLWLCSACPGEGEPAAQPPDEYHVGPGELLETRFSFEVGRPRIVPWRFDVPSLEVEATGATVPTRDYQGTDELLRSRTSCDIQWRLTCPPKLGEPLINTDKR